MTSIHNGDLVQLHYVGKLSTGAIFGTSRDGDPIEFVLGSGQMLSAVDEAILQMNPGEEKTIALTPEQGFGHRQEAGVVEVPLARLPEGVKTGDQLVASHEGREKVVWVRKVEGETATIDENHPLAGEHLTFELQLMGVTPATDKSDPGDELSK